MPNVRCRALRWVSDEPWVEVRLTDSDGTSYSFFDKPPVFEAGTRLTSGASYPLDIAVDCDVENDDGSDAVDIAMVHVETDDGRRRFRVRRELLG
jgi:hypothetical protein